MSLTTYSKQTGALVALTLILAMLGTSSAFAQHYTRTDLTTDSASVSNAPNIDPNLVNAWGIARGSGSPWWISDNGTGLTTLYDANGLPQSLVVSIPNPTGGTSAPTGAVFNAFNGAFELAAGQRSIFLFATEDGTISGWNPGVSLMSTVIKIDHSKAGAVYKGLAIGMTAGGPRIYVTNFAAGTVEVYDSKFRRINKNVGFRDEKLPANYAPFGIQNVGGNIVVTFAHRKPGSLDEDHGPGLGYVDVFSLAGQLLLRLQHNSTMNAPWGIAQAPGDFGAFSHRLIISNFGDGFLHAYNAVSCKHEGQLLDANGAPIWIDGLWAISFGGNSANNGMLNDLYFTAGPNDEGDGVLGKLSPLSSDQRGNSE
jgi:uncharacterized protein (TIGR03118 family)